MTLHEKAIKKNADIRANYISALLELFYTEFARQLKLLPPQRLLDPSEEEHVFTLNSQGDVISILLPEYKCFIEPAGSWFLSLYVLLENPRPNVDVDMSSLWGRLGELLSFRAFAQDVDGTLSNTMMVHGQLYLFDFDCAGLHLQAKNSLASERCQLLANFKTMPATKQALLEQYIDILLLNLDGSLDQSLIDHFRALIEDNYNEIMRGFIQGLRNISDAMEQGRKFEFVLLVSKYLALNAEVFEDISSYCINRIDTILGLPEQSLRECSSILLSQPLGPACRLAEDGKQNLIANIRKYIIIRENELNPFGKKDKINAANQLIELLEGRRKQIEVGALKKIKSDRLKEYYDIAVAGGWLKADGAACVVSPAPNV